MLSMQSFTVSKDVQIVDVIGLIQTELAPNTALQNGDDLASGTVLSLSPGSKITLRFDDGSEQLIIGKPDETLANNTQTTQQALESLIAQTQDQTATAATPDGVKDNINVLQASIESGDDIELPDTISGELAANEGTNFIKLDRDGKELLAVAGFDTTELDNAIELADETNIDAVNLANVNLPPVAEDDSFSLSEGTAVSGNVITHNDGDGVVDSDADGDILSVTQVVANGITTSVAAVGPTVVAIEGGSLSISADGEFTYTNTEGFDYDPLNPATQPSFIYTLTDGTYYDTATVLINIDDSAPVANGDNNGFVFREGIPGTVGGNVTGLGRMSSRDNADVFNGSNYASPTVTQVEYMGTTYKLDADNIATNPLQIDTQYGILSIDNIGGYTFDQKEDLIMVPDIEMNFTYTIQDGDVLKPETSSAVLSISISEPAPAPEIMTTQLSNDLDIDFNQTNGTIDTDFDVKALINVDEAIFVYGQNTDELSNILTDGHSGGLEIYLTVMAGDEGALVNIDPVAVLNNVYEEGFIVLEKGETDSGHGAFSTITNGLLADGAIIVNDVAAELSAPIAELDSQDFS